MNSASPHSIPRIAEHNVANSHNFLIESHNKFSVIHIDAARSFAYHRIECKSSCLLNVCVDVWANTSDLYAYVLIYSLLCVHTYTYKNEWLYQMMLNDIVILYAYG